jgi:hypothetical protein
MASVGGLCPDRAGEAMLRENPKTTRSIPIGVETKRFLDPPNSPLNPMCAGVARRDPLDREVESES